MNHLVFDAVGWATEGASGR